MLTNSVDRQCLLGRTLLEWLEDQAVIGTCWELAACDRALDDRRALVEWGPAKGKDGQPPLVRCSSLPTNSNPLGAKRDST
jgi:hypothetical protein